MKTGYAKIKRHIDETLNSDRIRDGDESELKKLIDGVESASKYKCPFCDGSIFSIDKLLDKVELGWRIENSIPKRTRQVFPKQFMHGKIFGECQGCGVFLCEKPHVDSNSMILGRVNSMPHIKQAGFRMWFKYRKY